MTKQLKPYSCEAFELTPDKYFHLELRWNKTWDELEKESVIPELEKLYFELKAYLKQRINEDNSE